MSQFKIKKITVYIAAVATIVICFLSVSTPLVTASVERLADGTVIPTRGAAYPFAVAWTIVTGLATFNVLYRQLKGSVGRVRQQVQLVVLGYACAFTFAVLTTVIFPNFTGDDSFNEFAPFSSLVLSAFLAYAIVAKGLLDIRLVVVRAFSYVLLLSLFGSAYVAFSVLVFESLLGLELDLAQQFSVFMFIFAVAITYPRLSSVFDRLTKKIFYQESYDTKATLDLLSEITVSKYEIDELVGGALSLIASTVRPSSMRAILLDTNGEYYSEYSSGRKSKVASMTYLEMLDPLNKKVLDVEEVEIRDREGVMGLNVSRMKQRLTEHNVTVAMKLYTNDEVVGYVLLGPKLSGNLYTQQDKGFLGIAANEMAIAIQNARRFDEIKRFNETLKLEVDRATKELRDSNEKLQALDQAKDEFVSMASHQLRTPLTSVKGYLSMVLEGDAGKVDKQQRDLLSAAFSSSQRMVYLISDLLNVSRLQTGKFVIEPTVTNLPLVVESEIDQLKEAAKAKKLKIKFVHPKSFPEVYLDETKIRQVMMNFIDNAIYYTPSGGSIEIALTANDKKIEYTVTDDGIGVPRHEQKNMFTKFYRATNAKKARPDGTGLGLFMAKKVVIDQGGAIIFHSKEGEGSTFGFTFPLTRVRPPETKQSKPKKASAKAKKPRHKKSK